MNLCEVNGKRSYTSRDEAKRASRTLGNRIRVYFCPACHCWHTTKDAEPLVRRKRRPTPRQADD